MHSDIDPNGPDSNSPGEPESRPFGSILKFQSVASGPVPTTLNSDFSDPICTCTWAKVYYVDKECVVMIMSCHHLGHMYVIQLWTALFEN